MLENIGNAITRLPMDRLGRNLGGRVASNRRLYRKTFSSVLVVLVLWVYRSKTSTLLMKFG